MPLDLALLNELGKGLKRRASPLELPQDLTRQRRVEIVRNRERPGTEAKGPWTRRRRGKRPELGDGSAITDDDKVLPGFDPVQQGVGVPLKILKTDSTHALILMGTHPGRVEFE